MIQSEIVNIRDKQYTRTWSDEGLMLERDGILYEEAIDPIDSARVYTESLHPIVLPDEEFQKMTWLTAL